jgi:simple sugar transport system permease protein
MAIGALNGFIVIRTGLPSFIVTLAFLFILRGFTIFLPQTDRAARPSSAASRRGRGRLARAAVRRQDLTGRSSTGWATPALIDVFERGTREGQPVVDGSRC